MHQALVEHPCSVVRQLGATRAGEMKITRFLRNPSVTVAEMTERAASQTARRVRGRHILAIQDGSDLVLGGKAARANGYGPVSVGGSVSGLVVHPVLAVEAGTGALLGLVGAEVWNRTDGQKEHRRNRPLEEKESKHWLIGAEKAGRVLQEAARITVVGDRESDIYEVIARRPANVDMLVRVAQNRLIENGTRLFTYVTELTPSALIEVTIPPAPGRAQRQALLDVRFAPVKLKAPLHGPKDMARTLDLWIVELREVAPPGKTKPLQWLLLTTHEVETLDDAKMIVGFYRQRWTIEQYFRTLKTGGFDIESAEISDPEAMERFVGAVVVAAVTVMQLVQARDGQGGQRLEDAFDPEDVPILRAICRKLEGKTQRQKNPHPESSLAFAAWIAARLGGWNAYYGKAGPYTMRMGLQRLEAILFGARLNV